MTPAPGAAAADTFDFVIVGSGAAGSILANRLSADGRTTVCLLEAGPPDRDLMLHVPAGFTRVIRNPRYAYQLSTEPSPLTAGRRIPTPQGRTLGGSTALNGMLYVRGQPEDFDEWAARGNAGWSYREVLPYFIRNEAWQGDEAGPHRGRTGPQVVTPNVWRHPLNEAFIQGAVHAGLPLNRDYNGVDQSGVGYYQRTIQGRWRTGTARGYLRPARNRPNLRIRTDARATRIAFDGRRACGVHYATGAADAPAARVAARREVIVCCGALHTPKLLMLSGIGPGPRLQQLGLPVLSALPGVGQHLRDHYSLRVVAEVEHATTINQQAHGPALWLEVAKWLLDVPSILTLSPAMVHFFWHSQTGAGRPDLQGVFTPAALGDRPGQVATRAAVTAAIWQHRPHSAGTVDLRSTDARADPLIEPRYLSDERDQAVLLAGLRLARRLLATPALARHMGLELQPGAALNSDDDLLAYARSTGASSYHYNGTARMGPPGDAQAVVDDQLRVRGVQGLRVVDASVMPTIPSANTCAATMMIAEKASDLILGRTPLPPLHVAPAAGGHP